MDLTFDPFTQISSALQGLQLQGESVAKSLLAFGARAVQEGNYTKALGAFQRAAALSPGSTDAQLSIARTYTLMGETSKAIDSYRKVLKSDPTSTQVRGELASYLLKMERYAEAEPELKQIVRAAPRDPGAAASLGFLYLYTDRLAQAEEQFQTVQRLAPKEATSYYNLGVVLSKEEKYDEAIAEFERALELEPEYAAAYADLAHAYLGTDDIEAAAGQLEFLDRIGTPEASALAYEVRLALMRPRIMYEDVTQGTFDTSLGPGTLDRLDPSLATPGASMTFTVVLHFNLPMDRESVEDLSNWRISKADGGEAGFYNYGSYLYPTRQISIGPYPVFVQYDREAQTATVGIRITQNAAGDGLIDPSHWVFQFSGTDAFGNEMDPTGDQWDHESLIGF